MTASTQSSQNQFNDEYISPHDSAELARLKNYATNQGYGESINFEGTEEMEGILTDLGFNEGFSKDTRDVGN